MGSIGILCFNLYQFLRYPYLIFKHPSLSKKVCRLLNAKNRVLSYYLSLILSIDQRIIKEIYYSSGTFKILTGTTFYKLGTSWGTLKIERDNIEIIHNEFPEIVSFIPPIQFINHTLFCSMRMHLYKRPSSAERLDCASRMLNELRKYSTKRLCAIDEFPHISRGLRLSKVLYKSLQLTAKVKELFSQPWTIGPVHGDFHVGNILISDDGLPFIIDLDNFSSNGIQALDAFSFWVDYKEKETAVSWQEIIRSALDGNLVEPAYTILGDHFEYDVKSVAFLYVLNRLGYENTYYRFLSRSAENEFRFIKELIN